MTTQPRKRTPKTKSDPRILRGDCLKTLKTLPDASIDSIVTDPPYELGFMGKSWDNSGIAYNQDLWAECLRVLKPGGHLLAFSGSRTYHRMVVAIEDSGFEIRDQIMWLYGSGFPKSLDVSKAIDKGTGESRGRREEFTAWMRSTGITAREIDQATGTNMGGHYLTDKSQPAIATADLFDLLRPLLPEVPEEIERLVAERTGIEWTAYKNREVVGTKTSGIANKDEGPRHTIGASKSIEVDITAPATPEAQQWQGWGTALKPAHEPIVVARKPLIGTVANNVLTYGTGALNIDGCRVGTDGGCSGASAGPSNGSPIVRADGRWPANVIHDGSDEVLAGFPNEAGRFFKSTPIDEADTQSFIYCAKASKSERNAGLEGQNFHTTVKPLALMRYLIKLVTPPGGTVLDPFLGSGSTAVAAILEGFEWIGCEMTAEYFPIIEARVKWATKEAAKPVLVVGGDGLVTVRINPLG